MGNDMASPPTSSSSAALAETASEAEDEHNLEHVMLCSVACQACSPILHKNHARWLWRHFALDVFHFCVRRPLSAQRCIGFGRDVEVLTSGWLMFVVEGEEIVTLELLRLLGRNT